MYAPLAVGRNYQPYSQGPLSSAFEKVPRLQLVTCQYVQIITALWVGPRLVKSKVQLYPGEGKLPFYYIVHSCSHVLKVDFKFALVWVVYAVVILKVKQALFLEPTRTDIECVRSCDQKPYLHNERKGGICIKIVSLLQDGRPFFVYSSNMAAVTSCEHTP